MPDGPDVKDPLKDLLDGSLLKEGHHGAHPGDVDVNLPVGVAVDVVVLGGEVLLDVTVVLVSLAGHHLQGAPRPRLGLRGVVPAQRLPSLGPHVSRGDSRPRQASQLFQLEGGTGQQQFQLGLLGGRLDGRRDGLAVG